MPSHAFFFTTSDTGDELQPFTSNQRLLHTAFALPAPARHAFIRCRNVLNAAGTYAEALPAAVSRSVGSQDFSSLPQR
jgi:hypothetical protein